MKVEYSEEGGIAFFPGLAKPRVINLSALTREVADELRQLISDADFWNLPAELSSISKRVPDSRLFIITIEDRDKLHTVKIAEPVDNPHVRILLKTIQNIIRNPRKSSQELLNKP